MKHKLLALDPNINLTQVSQVGQTMVQHYFKGHELAVITEGYMEGIKDVFVFALTASAFSTLLSLIVPFKRLSDYSQKVKEEQEAHA